LSNTGATPGLISALAGVQNIIFAAGCVPLYWTIERTGRRSTLLYGAMTMTILLVVFIALVAVPQTASIRWTSIGILWLFLFVMGYAYEGAVWLYCAEISPLEYRHIGGAATSAGEWLGTWLTVFVGPIGFDNAGWHFWFWVLSGNLVAIVFVFFLCPETGGKTLEQVDNLFAAGGIMAGMAKLAHGEEEWVETSNEEQKRSAVKEVR
jgi:MFS family permease